MTKGRTARLVALLVLALAAVAFASAASAGNYIVLYKGSALPADTAATIAKAGGSVVYSYPQIGVVIASSSNASFRDSLLKDQKIENAAATEGFATQLSPLETVEHDGDGGPGDLPNLPATDGDHFSPLQWDMMQIHTPEAHAISGGSPLVVAGDIDTGLDKDHPDLIQNIDFSRSVSCLGGVPNQDPNAWDDHNGHGTHTAGTIAAASNGFGIVGVAPNVKVAGIKAGNDAGFFFPEAVICAFVWAGTHQIDVTNNSYYADPYLYNCRNDPVQRAIWKAEQRAILFAEQNGVTVIAAQGNDSDDRAHPTFDNTSPDVGTAVDRQITNACVVVPLEVPGVVGVTATGDGRQVDGDDDPDDYLKSYYSAYGVGVAEVTAPGGDFYYGRSPRAVNGLVLSTWPAEIGGSRRLTDPAEIGHPTAVYRYLQGTSMASPHAAGVAALIISRYGNLNSPQNGKMRPNQVAAFLQQTASPQPCPTEFPLSGAPGSALFGVPYLNITRLNGETQMCQGGPGYNSWYGNGRIDALNAVTHSPGN
jgi:subtilisin family serine protease